MFVKSKLFKLLNKGCRSPISELTKRDKNNNYIYKNGNVEFNKLNKKDYKNNNNNEDIDNNDIKNLEDNKMNTKEK